MSELKDLQYDYKSAEKLFKKISEGDYIEKEYSKEDIIIIKHDYYLLKEKYYNELEEAKEIVNYYEKDKFKPNWFQKLIGMTKEDVMSNHMYENNY